MQITNRFVDSLPGDALGDCGSREVLGACYSLVSPAKCTDPQLAFWSADTAKILGLGDATGELNGTAERRAYADLLSGNSLHEGMKPYAMCYGGYQFGHWAGQLGDGRAIALGEVQTEDKHWALQLKGAGRTPYSRTADGLAVLRSSLREYLCSEAMLHLGISSTRVLSLVLTGDSVVRDMFYDGHPREEPGAVVCRVSPSFIRFGNFEIFSTRQDHASLRALLEFVIEHYYPELGDQPADTDRYLQFYRQVVKRTARLMVDWQRVGFVHGVMNTDNMSILGETIDYGPYGWLEPYQPNWTPNTTDAQGRRYCYGNQPGIGMWNVARLGEALLPLIEDESSVQSILDEYETEYQALWQAALWAKLGMRGYRANEDDALIERMFELLQLVETDMTLFFRSLSQLDTQAAIAGLAQWPPQMREAFYQAEDLEQGLADRWAAWLKDYAKRVAGDTADINWARQMDAINPLYVCRNYLAQQAIDAAEQGDFSVAVDLMGVLREPYMQQDGKESYAKRRPEWARNKAGCSMLSCSS